RSNFDRTHNYALTTIYDLPIGPGRKWLTSGVGSKIIGGWQVSTLFVAQSGVPLSITANGTLFNTPGNSAYADQVGTPTILGALGQPEHRLQRGERHHVRPGDGRHRQPAQHPLWRSLRLLGEPTATPNSQLPTPNSQLPRRVPWELGIGNWELGFGIWALTEL